MKIDTLVFVSLLILLGFLIFGGARANIQSDSIDYYVILQKLTGNEPTIVKNTYFVEQRSPGYSLLSMLPYYFISFAIEPFVKTQEIAGPDGNEAAPPDVRGSEGFLIPERPLLVRDIFFNDFYVKEEGSWFKWKIILSLLLTSYIMLIIGIFLIIKTLALEGREFFAVSSIMVVILTSGIFMHNIIGIPAYATLAAFGVSSVFCYFFVKSFLSGKSVYQLLAGLAIGLLVLIRLESGLFFVVSLPFLALEKNRSFLRNYVAGFAAMMPVLAFYNQFMFGNPLHYGILKGDINLISFDFGYIFSGLFNPDSGIFFWSPLISLGIVGLFFSRQKYSRMLGFCCAALMGLYLLKVPAMYYCIGKGIIPIGGLLVTCPNNINEALNLIRYDMNRYITVLAPFSLIGLHNLVACLTDYIKKPKPVGSNKSPANP